MKKLILLAIFGGLFTTAQAQFERTLLGDLDLTGAWGGLTYNYTNFGEDWALVRGGFGGVEFGNTFYLGYGGWHTKDEVRTEVGREEFELRHGGFIVAFTPQSHRAIHPRASFIFGPGRIKTPDNGDKDRVFVIQPALGVELNIFQAMRLGIEGGYRAVGNVNIGEIQSEDVSGFFIQIEARFGFSW